MTVALFWEFGEYASDLILITDVQHSVSETMSDLIAGSLGAMIVIILFALFRRYAPKN